MSSPSRSHHLEARFWGARMLGREAPASARHEAGPLRPSIPQHPPSPAPAFSTATSFCLAGGAPSFSFSSPPTLRPSSRVFHPLQSAHRVHLLLSPINCSLLFPACSPPPLHPLLKINFKAGAGWRMAGPAVSFDIRPGDSWTLQGWGRSHTKPISCAHSLNEP